MNCGSNIQLRVIVERSTTSNKRTMATSGPDLRVSFLIEVSRAPIII
jgi:hypothetical protein